jgi:hypothetical protein
MLYAVLRNTTSRSTLPGVFMPVPIEWMAGVILAIVLNVTANRLPTRFQSPLLRWGWFGIVLYFTVLIMSFRTIRSVLWTLGGSKGSSYVAAGLIGAIVAVVYWAAINEVYGRIFSQSGRPSATSVTSANLKLPDEIREARITVNDFDFPRNVESLEKFGVDLGRGQPKGAPTISGGRVYFEDRHPYFDGQIKVGDITVEIKRNRLIATPDGWDRNENDRAIEIISDKRKVVFQLILESAEHVYIDAGRYVNDENWTTERLFRYPSSEHRGELAEWVSLLPLTAKTLYQFFVTDCKASSTRTTRNLADKFQVERVICRNLDTKSAYLSVFVPQPNAEPVIEALASGYKEMIDEEDRAGFSKGTVFTGRIFIYHDRYLLDRQIKSLTTALKNAGADPVFYGPDEQVKRNSPLYQQ